MIIIYDSICILCVNSVIFIIKRDKQGKFKFVNAQSKLGKKLLEKHHSFTNELDTMVLIKDNQAYIKSDAVLNIAKELDGYWKYLYIFKIIPKFIRDKIYIYIAKNRYKFFGKKDVCHVKTKDIENRFLE